MLESVYRAVRTDSLYEADYVLSLKGQGPVCLLNILSTNRDPVKFSIF